MLPCSGGFFARTSVRGISVLTQKECRFSLRPLTYVVVHQGRLGGSLHGFLPGGRRIPEQSSLYRFVILEIKATRIHYIALFRDQAFFARMDAIK
jgi:hypothetical protein